MSFDADLKAALSGLLAGGCHKRVNNSTSITLPYAVFHDIAGLPQVGISQPLGITNGSVQIDIFAASPEAAKGLALGIVKNAVEGLGAILFFHMDGEYDPTDRTFQYITEYQNWSLDNG